jgi:hypothetical protein
MILQGSFSLTPPLGSLLGSSHPLNLLLTMGYKVGEFTRTFHKGLLILPSFYLREKLSLTQSKLGLKEKGLL